MSNKADLSGQLSAPVSDSDLTRPVSLSLSLERQQTGQVVPDSTVEGGSCLDRRGAREAADTSPIDGADADAGSNARHRAAESLGNLSVPGSPHDAPTPVAQPARPAPRRRHRAPWTPRQRAAIEADARGEPVEVICGAAGTPGRPLPRSTLRRWRALPAWPGAVLRARAALAGESEALRVAVRARALRAAYEALDRPDADPALVRAALAATQPDGEERQARARAAVLRSLPPELRRQVAAHLEGDDAARLAAMSDDELEAVLASEGQRR